MVNGGILLFGGIRARDVPQTIAIFDAMCKINSVLIVVSAESGVLACIRSRLVRIYRFGGGRYPGA